MDKKLIRKILIASGVKPRELVLVHFWGEDEDLTIMHNFCIELAALGCSPFPLQQSRKVNHKLFTYASPKAFDEKYMRLWDEVDTVLDVFTYQPVVLTEKLGASRWRYTGHT